MKTSYPHPVLGHEDDIETGQFSLKCTRGPLIGGENTEMSLFFDLTNPTLRKLIEDGRADYVVEVSCKQTFYKFTERSHAPSVTVKLNSTDIRGTTSVKGWILSREIIEDYSPEGMNHDYMDANFFISPGDVLAEDPGFWFIADKEFDALKAPVSSFIVVGANNSENGPLEVSWGNGNTAGDKIVITLNKNDFNLYKEIARDNDAKKILHSAIVLPVLVQGVIGVLEGEGSDYYNHRLAAVIATKERRGQIDAVDTNPPIITAQNLLKEPLTRSLTGAAALLSEQEVEEDE